MIPIGGSAPMVLGIVWGLTAVTFIFVVLRLYTRIKVLHAYGPDDRLFNAAFVFLVAYCATITIAAGYGFGQPLGAILKQSDATRGILWEAVGQTILTIAVWLSKTSLACFLLRLGAKTPHKIVLITPSVALGLAVIVSLSLFWTMCRPLAFFWDRSLPEGLCFPAGAYASIVAGALSVLCDFWYAAYPWFMLWNVRIPRREKLLVQISLSLGVLAGACGIERAIQLQTLTSPEYLRDTSTLIIWHAAELSMTLICIGIPVCRPLYGKWPLDGVSWPRPRQYRETGGERIRYTIRGSDLNSSKNRTRGASDEVKDDASRESDFGAATPGMEITVVPGSLRRLPMSHYHEERVISPIRI